MEGVTLKHFNKFKLSTLSMNQLHYILSNDFDQYYRTTITNHIILLHSILLSLFMISLFAKIYDQIDGCEKQYTCAPGIYPLHWLDLKFL